LLALLLTSYIPAFLSFTIDVCALSSSQVKHRYNTY